MRPQTHPDRTTPVAKQPRGSDGAEPSRTRARIIEAAAQLYRQIGHRKTTVADIAHEMSMSPANVYRFFLSKQAIEEAVAGKLLDEITAAAVDAANRAGPAIERLQAVLRAVERQHEFNSDNNSRLYELVASAMRENWTIAGAYTDCIHSTVAQIISEGQASGEFSRGDPMIIARCVLSATSACLNPSLIPGCANLARPKLSQMIDFCSGALRAAGSKGKPNS